MATSSYPASKQVIPTYAGTALQGNIDHADWHDLTNKTVQAIEDVLGTTAGTSVLKNFTAGDFCAKTTDIPSVPAATGAEINTGTATSTFATPKAIADSNIAFTTDLTNYFNLYAPEGFLINGKIAPSVASNNLTVAIKGMDGNDPSATNPVYCRIGNTIRSITSALSVTKNSGTNWFNSGASATETKELDYFVYLGYNATDGVVVGFSRIPYGKEYDSFSTTSTSDLYCAISTITNAAAGDDYVNIGRFAATLSAGAGYTWTVPTFTNKNLIQRPIYETRLMDFVASWSGIDDGSSGQPSNTCKFKIINNRCICTFVISYSSGYKVTTNASFSQSNIPMSTSINNDASYPSQGAYWGCDNGGVPENVSPGIVVFGKYGSKTISFRAFSNITDNQRMGIGGELTYFITDVD